MKIIYLSTDMSSYGAASYQHLFMEGMRGAAYVYSYGPGFADYARSDALSDICAKSGWGTDFDAVFVGHSWLRDGPDGPVDPQNTKLDVDRPVFFFLNKEYSRLEEKIGVITGYRPATVFSHHHDVASLVGRDLPWDVVDVPFAADETLFKPAPKQHDLFFSGILRNPTYPESQADDRIRIQSQLFRVIGGIRLGSKVSFEVFWNSFTSNRLIDRLNRYRRLDESEYVSTMGSSRIVLNSLSPVNLIGTRFFETMLSEAVCLSPSSASFAKFLSHGVNCYFYDGPEQFVETVESLLDRPEELKTIAAAGRLDALENHTWSNRVNQVLEVINKWV